jgi:arylsulfatase A-like enzyme
LPSRSVLCVAVALVAAFAPTAPALATHTGKQPNVLMIMTDDQRLDGTMAVMSKTRYRFKSNGTWFPDAYATTPLCCPSRTSFFSGRYNHNNQVHGNSEARYIEEQWTIQRYLQDAGYFTGLFGKFLNGWNIWIEPSYWDRFSIYGGYTGGGYYPTVNENGTIKTLYERTPPYYETHYVRDQAIRFLAEAERDDDRPWFLYLTTKAPHVPHTPEEKYASAPVPPFEAPPNYFETDLSDKPDWVRRRQYWPPNIQTERTQQLQTLMSVDDMVDRVFRELGRRDEEQDTLAFFVSDNGYFWGEHGQGAKGPPYAEGIKLPFFARWPSHPNAFRRGTRDTRLVTNIDFAPTVLDATDVTATQGSPPMDGVSLLDKSRQRNRIFTEFWRNGDFNPGIIPPWASVRTRTYHYIEYYKEDGGTPLLWPDGSPVREYYDLTNDPYELVNLLHDGDSQNDPPTASIESQLQRDRLCSGDSCPPGTQPGPTTDQVDPVPDLASPPPPGATLTGPFILTAFAHDNIGVVGLQYKLDAANLGPEDSSIFYNATWDTTQSANGPHTIAVQARDPAGNVGSASYPFSVDNSSPRAIDVQTCAAPATCGPTPGTVENGDTITYYFSTAMDPTSLVPGWSGGARAVTARVNPDVPSAGYDDNFTVDGVPGLGAVDLGFPNYTATYYDPHVFAGSSMQMSADLKSLTVTLGGGLASVPHGDTAVMGWASGAGLRGASGTPGCACYVMETGPYDREF